jgi:DNA-binding protein Fis
MMVENQCRFARPLPTLEKQRCHFIYNVETASGIAPEGNAGSDEHLVVEEMEESILKAFELDLDDVSSMNSEEYGIALKEYDEELVVVDQPSATQQVFATMMGLARNTTAP